MLSEGSEICEGFGNIEKFDKENYLAGQCFLKTKTDKFKDHWAVLNGGEIFCYRDQNDTKFRVMHSLAGTFIKELPPEKDPDSDKNYFPVKIVLPPNKSRILYFATIETQQLWMRKLLQTIGYSCVQDFYDLSIPLGKGQFGLVKLGTHKRTGKQVAIKTVKKANMKPIEVF